MFLADKSPRIYVGLYQKFLYKIFSLLLTPSSTNIILIPPAMRRRLHMGQGAQCYIQLKKLRPYVVVSAHFPNALPMQRLGNLCVTHQSQVTHCGLSCKAVFFSSVTVPGGTFHCDKRFAVVRGDDPDEGLFEKLPAPPPP